MFCGCLGFDTDIKISPLKAGLHCQQKKTAFNIPPTDPGVCVRHLFNCSSPCKWLRPYIQIRGMSASSSFLQRQLTAICLSLSFLPQGGEIADTKRVHCPETNPGISAPPKKKNNKKYPATNSKISAPQTKKNCPATNPWISTPPSNPHPASLVSIMKIAVNCFSSFLSWYQCFHAPKH